MSKLWTDNANNQKNVINFKKQKEINLDRKKIQNYSSKNISIKTSTS